MILNISKRNRGSQCSYQEHLADIGHFTASNIKRMTSELSQFQQLIHAVSDTCDLRKCREILESGLDINSTTSAGCTALMFAVMPNDYGDQNTPHAIMDVVKVLLSHGADITMTDSHGMKAVDYARQLIDPNWTDVFGYPVVDQWDNSTDQSILAEIINLLDD